MFPGGGRKDLCPFGLLGYYGSRRSFLLAEQSSQHAEPKFLALLRELKPALKWG